MPFRFRLKKPRSVKRRLANLFKFRRTKKKKSSRIYLKPQRANPSSVTQSQAPTPPPRRTRMPRKTRRTRMASKKKTTPRRLWKRSRIDAERFKKAFRASNLD